MKKIMIAAAIVCAAVVSQAASITWSTDTNGILLPSGETSMGESGVTMYFWSIDLATYGKLTEGGANAVSSAVWGKYGSDLASATDSAPDDFGAIELTDAKSYSSGDTAYAAVIFTYDGGDGVTHYKGNVGSYEFTASADMTVYSMDSLVFGSEVGTTALEWSSVPEPTSGLLLLLGVAGLALRRRRA